MAFDQKTRNLLQRTVTACRRALDKEFTAQLQELFGIQPDGPMTPLAGLQHLGDEDLDTARLLRERINHLEGGDPADALARTAAQPDHVKRVIREQAFTVLNRLAALRLCEERGLVLECVRKGTVSEGFQLFQTNAGSALGETHEAYRTYLYCLFDELAIDLGVLFDRYSPFALLFPRKDALDEVLRELNGSGKAAESADITPEQFAEIWRADETIGWIYQYYNDESERKKMREESSAPRNSRELAVRNQFFTPRYVVEFLTDNTLGRIWYEMTQGQTRLKDQCRYLVRRPDEVFLGRLSVVDPEFPGISTGVVKEAGIIGGNAIKDPFNEFTFGREEDAQRLIDFAHLCDGYQRHDFQRERPEDANSVLRDGVRAWDVDQPDFAGCNTQRLMDFLFLAARADHQAGGVARHSNGTIYSTLINSRAAVNVANEVRRRVLAGRGENVSQEELLRSPVFIPYRPLKDPREVKLLDPACGSMHFGLYAFDLFTVIYEEAWELPGIGDKLRQDFQTLENYRLQISRLIIEHNIHGIDIDPRAAQIAGLSLWLRAQRAWHDAGIKPADRPRITRANIVCAEPMPGEKSLLRDFVEQQFPARERPAFAFLLERIFDRMSLAGEAGSLLKIEEEIRDAIAEARKLAHDQRAMKQAHLFAGMEKPEQMEFDLRKLNDDEFWQAAEQRIYDALKQFAEQAESGGGFQRRLFADDAAQGFAFIDLCRKQYDVVVMNPPFGEAAISTRGYIAGRYPDSKDDIYAAFVARMISLLPAGLLGVISNRTGFFLTSMQRWRETTLLSEPSLNLLADLGDGVLDGALVEAAAYIISPKAEPSSIFFRLLDQDDKARPLGDNIAELSAGRAVHSCFIQKPRSFRDFPECRISYWASESIRRVFQSFGCAAESRLSVQFGLSTKDDWRFLRLCWEIHSSEISCSQDCCLPSQKWMHLAKGGEYALHFGDIHLVANWANRGREIGERVIQLYPYLNGDPNWVLHSEVPYGKPGVTYTNRTTSGFSPRVLPPGCLISSMGCTIFADNHAKLPCVLATYASRAFGYLLEFNVASGDSVHSGSAARHYEIGTIASIPIPNIADVNAQAGEDAIAIWKRKSTTDSYDETSRYFLSPIPHPINVSLTTKAVAMRARALHLHEEILEEASEAESTIRDLYSFDAAAREACDSEFGPDVTCYPRILSESDRAALLKLWSAGMPEVVASTSQVRGFARFISKMTFIADRRLELLCHRFHAHPAIIADAVNDLPATKDESSELASTSVLFVLGVAFGRWDIRYATGERQTPELPDPFAPLPVCPPGMLQNAQGLPAGPEDVPVEYPVKNIPWDGILVDDPNHPLDLERRIREVIGIIWKDRAEAIEREACEILGVNALRDYFRRPAGFFADHLKRYSKSRRQAPIYWPLSTANGSFTLWIYYHRLTTDTLYKCIKIVADKLAELEKEITHLRTVLAADEGGTKERKRLEQVEDLRRDLNDFREELEHWAPKWKPNLNDGVIITASPLWKLFRLPKWQKDLKACWHAMEKGDYDWAHLAYTLWPDRVREKCKTDRSLAIAHNLEEICEVKPPEKKAKKAKKEKKGQKKKQAEEDAQELPLGEEEST